jgi:hypothetical protein
MRDQADAWLFCAEMTTDNIFATSRKIAIYRNFERLSREVGNGSHYLVSLGYKCALCDVCDVGADIWIVEQRRYLACFTTYE